MDSVVHRHGLTVLHSGVTGDNDAPVVNLVFVHGLWGHPQGTWQTQAPKIAKAKYGTSTRPSHKVPQRRKSSLVEQFVKAVGSKSPQLNKTSTFSSNSTDSYQLVQDKQSPEADAVVTTPKDNMVYWPLDLLPMDLPRARVMTYGYDADVIGTRSGNHLKMNNFTMHGQDLLVKLQREISNEIPIIFCAHSLGGIIVKDALHRSKTNLNKNLKKVHELTKCVVFLGTPHRGSRMAHWSEMCTKIAQLTHLDIRQKLVNNLRVDSEILEVIQSEFVKMLHTGDFYIHSFQEGRPINQVFGKVVDDYSSRFDEHPMQTVEVIDASHRDMARFRSEHDAGYRQVTAAFRHYISKLTTEVDQDRKSIASNFSVKELNMRTFFSVPFARNAKFVGREADIQEIEKRFSGPAKAQWVAVHGLGGIGKSQVAIELAYRWKDSYPKTSVIWLHASSRRRFEQSLRDVMSCIGIQETPNTSVPRVVEEWLRNESNGRWLMIVDNVDDEDVIFEKGESGEEGPAELELLSCIPKVNHGSVLFTSRYMKVAGKISDELIDMKEMDEEDATQLLKKLLGGAYSESKSVCLLLEELGHIPLAITHAAAFMRENCESIPAYLDIYRRSEEERIGLLEESFPQLTVSGPKIPKQVLATWSITFDYVTKDSNTGQLASDLLSVMSFMDRQGIPKSLLQTYSPEIPKFKYSKAFGILKATSLISEDEQGAFNMHRLVQLAMRRWLKLQGKDRLFAERAVEILAKEFPDGSFKTWKDCSSLIVHAEAVLGLSTVFTDMANSESREHLLMNVATFQRNRGQYENAEAKLAEVLKLRTDALGADDPETLRAADSLTLVLRHQAKYVAAEDLARKTMLKKEEIFGQEHPDTLNTAHIVATILGDRGMHVEAGQENRNILEARRRLLGPDHPDTLQSSTNLTLSLWELGQFAEAEKLAREVFDARGRIFGDEHPDTLDIAATLGFILEAQGRLSEAGDVKRHVLDFRERVLGEDHPDTADSLHDMGWILHQQGHYMEAGEYYNRALTAKLKLLGGDHPKTLTTLCNLPVFFCDKGDYQAAEKASKKIVSDFQRVQGTEHPQTLDALGDMAVVYRHEGKLDAALAAAQKSIEGREKVIGKDHPWTLPTVSHLGYILALQNQALRGEGIIRSALAGLESQLGVDHSQAMNSVVQLSKTLVLQDDPSKLGEAEALARRAMQGRTKELGQNHPYTYKSVYHLAHVLLAQKRYDEAAALCHAALGGMQDTLGSEHPDVTKCDNDYTKILQLKAMEDPSNLKNTSMVIDLRED